MLSLEMSADDDVPSDEGWSALSGTTFDDPTLSKFVAASCSAICGLRGLLLGRTMSVVFLELQTIELK